MADIKSYTNEIQNAVYGEEVRSSIINALNKVNDDNNSYQDIKNQVIKSKDTIVEVGKKIDKAKTNIKELIDATTKADTSKEQLTTATTSAQNALNEILTNKGALDNLKSVSDNINNTITTITHENETVKTNIKELKSENETAKTNIKELKSENETVKTNIKELKSENESAKANIKELKSESTQSLKAEINNLKEKIKNLNQSEIDYNKLTLTVNGVYLGCGIADEQSDTPVIGCDTWGLYNDILNSRKKCIIANNGVVLAYEHDKYYTEQGYLNETLYKECDRYPRYSQVHVMIEQPKIYYKKILDSIFLFNKPIFGSKVHPAFIKNGKEYDKIYLSVYPAVIYDQPTENEKPNIITGAGKYNKDSAKFVSCKNEQPIANLSKREAQDIVSRNGKGWSLSTFGSISLTSYLQAINLVGQLNITDEKLGEKLLSRNCWVGDASLIVKENVQIDQPFPGIDLNNGVNSLAYTKLITEGGVLRNGIKIDCNDCFEQLLYYGGYFSITYDYTPSNEYYIWDNNDLCNVGMVIERYDPRERGYFNYDRHALNFNKPPENVYSRLVYMPEED